MHSVVKHFVLFVWFIGVGQGMFASDDRQHTIDSLTHIVKITKDKKELFKPLYHLTLLSISHDPHTAIDYVNQTNTVAKELNDSSRIALANFLQGLELDEMNEKDSALNIYTIVAEQLKKYDAKQQLAQCYTYMAGIIMAKGDYQQALKLYKQSEEITTAINETSLSLSNLTYIGLCYSQMGDLPKSITFFQKALTIAEKLDAKDTQSQLYLYIGSAYDDSKNSDYAMDYFKKSQQMAEQLRDTSMLIAAEIYIANNYYYKKDYEKAINLYKHVASIAENSAEQISTYAGALGNIGNTYTDIGKIQESQEYQFKAIHLFKTIEDNQGLCECYTGVGKNYFILKQYSKAIEYFTMALHIAQSMNSLENLMNSYRELAKTYEASNDTKNAYANFKLFHQLSDSIYNTSNVKKLTELEMSYRFENKEKEVELIQKNKEILAAEKLKHQKLISYSSILGILFLSILIGILYRSSVQRKKANNDLKILNSEIVLKNSIIQEKNQEITGSINYAKRIQSSFLTSETYISRRLSEYFILFKPRDIVSGDFYWVAEKNNNLYVCTADSTGHGIPGAFMSLIGMSILNEIINSKNNIEHTDEILNELRRIVILALNPEGATDEGKDGMDAVLCRFDFQKMQLEYSSANNAFYIIRKGVLLEFKPDKMPIGKYLFDEKPFTQHTIPLEKGDCIYTFSDGYADQFGGPNGKKFKYAQLKQLLLTIHSYPMPKQKMLLKEHFDQWKGNMEQVDDVCILGIRV
jgi:tetratricopeptide (TPR) repeat protein